MICFLDSPKLRNKGQLSKNVRPNSVIMAGSSSSKQSGPFKAKTRPSTHNIVVVKEAAKQESLDKDPDIVRLQVSSILLLVRPFQY